MSPLNVCTLSSDVDVAAWAMIGTDRSTSRIMDIAASTTNDFFALKSLVAVVGVVGVLYIFIDNSTTLFHYTNS